jgi:hypothetical protein
MIRRLSPDMCILSSSSISKPTNFRPLTRREIHRQRRARLKVNICFFKEEADHPLLLLKPHAQREDCAKLLTLKRPVDYDCLIVFIERARREAIQGPGEPQSFQKNEHASEVRRTRIAGAWENSEP